ncbi:MAG: sulfotransferase domain-containing protein [Planctomycetota bacterium]
MKRRNRDVMTHFRPRESDVFFVSYPRSGSTWVRFLLANLIRYDSGEPVDFHSVHQIIPDLMQKEYLEMLPVMPSPRLLKSHHLYDPRFRRVVYILRDGRDVMVSYYYFLTGKGRFEASFLEFLKKKDLKPSLWHEHVESWLLRGDHSDILVVRYEDLCRQTETKVEQMARFAGLPCDEARLRWAISNASFEAMRRIEAEKGLAFGADRWSPTIRKGIVGDWQDHFEADHKDVFKRYANRALLRLGYVEDEAW